MTDAPKTVGLVHNGFGGWRLWTADDADDPTVVAVPYILAAEHDRAEALQAQLAEARDKALEEAAIDPETVARAICYAWGGCAGECHSSGGTCRGHTESLMNGWHGECAVAAIRAMKGARG